jgi:hypothetical protein
MDSTKLEHSYEMIPGVVDCRHSSFSYQKSCARLYDLGLLRHRFLLLP